MNQRAMSQSSPIEPSNYPNWLRELNRQVSGKSYVEIISFFLLHKAIHLCLSHSHLQTLVDFTGLTDDAWLLTLDEAFQVTGIKYYKAGHSGRFQLMVQEKQLILIPGLQRKDLLHQFPFLRNLFPDFVTMDAEVR